MMSRPYDLAIAYRIYPFVSKNPPLYPNDKLALAAMCLHSFKASLGALRVKIWVILDTCPPEYKTLFSTCFDSEDITLIQLERAGNAATFYRQLQVLINQSTADLVYLAEDDYYYLPGQLETMVHFLKERKDVDFITPYDHPDYYILGLHADKKKAVVWKDKQWRRACTTCLTFLTTQSNLKEAHSMFMTYLQRNYDTSIWMSLTKEAALRPSTMYRALVNDHLWKAVVKTWRFGLRQILLGRRWKLWYPVPSIATHMDSSGMAPGIDWESYWRETLKQIEDSPQQATGPPLA